MVPPRLLHLENEDEFGRRLEHDSRFLARVERARKAFREGKGVKLEDVKFDNEKPK